VVEITDAISQVKSVQVPPFVCVIPVRMQEAWLLFDEAALRRAAGNPNGHQVLDLPDVAQLEELPNPKNILHELLRQASGLSSRRVKKFSVNERVHRVAELIDDFTPLRSLPAFMILEAEIKQLIKAQSW
jgi:hypothetical protein